MLSSACKCYDVYDSTLCIDWFNTVIRPARIISFTWIRHHCLKRVAKCKRLRCASVIVGTIVLQLSIFFQTSTLRLIMGFILLERWKVIHSNIYMKGNDYLRIPLPKEYIFAVFKLIPLIAFQALPDCPNCNS